MANIKKNIYGEIVIEGDIIQDDINYLNRIESDATVVLNSTRGFSSELLKKINNSKLNFKVYGGLNPSKLKYDNKDYQDRTIHTRDELIKIIEYFEDIEKGLTPEMSEMQKSMYIYSCIIQDTNYVTRYNDNDIYGKLIENNLAGNLYHKLTCAGIALTYKELLDRQGIKCEYLNKRCSHSFNRLELDGKKYGIDLTWDLNSFERKGSMEFIYFGRQTTKEFYVKYHNLSNEPDETMDELSTFTEEEIKSCYESIKPLLDKREKHIAAVSQMTTEDKIGSLKLHYEYNEIQKEAYFIEVIKFLKRERIIKENDYRYVFASMRSPIVGDIVGRNIARLSDAEGAIANYDIERERRPKEHITQLLEATDNYLVSYVKNFFESSGIYADTIKYISPEESIDLNIYYENLRRKIEFFNTIKDIVIRMGYKEELNYFNGVIKQEEAKKAAEKHEKEEMKSPYDYACDFLESLLNPCEMIYIKEYIEGINGRKLSLEEFKIYFTNPTFMRTIFNKKIVDKNWTFSNDELSNLLNKVYDENSHLMSTIEENMKKQDNSLSIPREQIEVPKVEIDDEWYEFPSFEESFTDDGLGGPKFV